tara:strand:- start:255 stop:596 length:342 start_codon:yes stop_codon:yes gene_type:complete
MSEGPTCGHSACSQHYIDNGSTDCIREEDAHIEAQFLDNLTAMLHDVEQAWRCQLGSDLFAAAVACARAGLVVHPDFVLLDTDMVAYLGDRDWHLHTRLVYGPVQRVEHDLPF